MMLDAEMVDVIACALRPAGTWGRFVSLVLFVVATVWVSDRRRGASERV